MVKRKIRRSKEVERSMPSVVEGFRKVLSEHGLNEFNISNIKLVSGASAKPLNAENTDSGHWEWKCKGPANNIECGWEWVKD